MKALNTSNETVLALGANFSHSADSHLVAMQVEIFVNLFVHSHSILFRGRMEAIKPRQSIFRTRSGW